MAHFYDIIKANAQMFANERGHITYIAKANKKTDYKILFSKDEKTPSYQIIEEVRPQKQGGTV